MENTPVDINLSLPIKIYDIKKHFFDLRSSFLIGSDERRRTIHSTVHCTVIKNKNEVKVKQFSLLSLIRNFSVNISFATKKKSRKNMASTRLT